MLKTTTSVQRGATARCDGTMPRAAASPSFQNEETEADEINLGRDIGAHRQPTQTPPRTVVDLGRKGDIPSKADTSPRVRAQGAPFEDEVVPRFPEHTPIPIRRAPHS